MNRFSREENDQRNNLLNIKWTVHQTNLLYDDNLGGWANFMTTFVSFFEAFIRCNSDEKRDQYINSKESHSGVEWHAVWVK